MTRAYEECEEAIKERIMPVGRGSILITDNDVLGLTFPLEDFDYEAIDLASYDFRAIAADALEYMALRKHRLDDGT